MIAMKRNIIFTGLYFVMLFGIKLFAQEATRPQYISEWTIYMSETAGGKPAEVLVDLGVETVTPAPGYHFQCSFLLTLKEPDSTGLRDLKDPQLLEQIEERLATSMRWSKGVYFGRVTSSGYRDYYFFLPDSSTFRAKCNRVMQDFPGYSYKMQIEHDPYWFNYFNIYPDEYTLQIQYNQDKVKDLVAKGDSLSQPRVLQHFANFPTERDRQRFERDLSWKGFYVVGLGENPGDLPYGILFSKKQSMEPEKLEETTLLLVDLAMQNGGYYDGWICEPVIPKDK